MTLPLGEGALGAPVALAEAEAGAFRRAQASFGGFSLSHRKGGAYGYDAILDISKDGRAVASIARDSTNGLDSRSYSVSRPMAETIISGGGTGELTAYDRAGNKAGDFVGHEGYCLGRRALARWPLSRLGRRKTKRCGCGTSRRASCSSRCSAGRTANG